MLELGRPFKKLLTAQSLKELSGDTIKEKSDLAFVGAM
jgi:hypothetical protein